MATRAQKLKLGIFFAAAGALTVVTVAILAGLQLWQPKDRYYVVFSESVSGLELGAPVKLQGVRIGNIGEIKVSPQNLDEVRVGIDLDSGTGLPRGSTASMGIQGITGLRFIEIQAGRRDAGLLKPGEELRAGTDVFSSLTGKAEDIALKLELLVTNLLNITRAENQARADHVLAAAEELTVNLNDLALEVTAASKTAREIMQANQKNFGAAVAASARTAMQLEELAIRANTLTAEARTSLADMNLPKAVAGLNETNLLLQERLLSIDVAGTVARLQAALMALQDVGLRASQSLGKNEDQVRSAVHSLQAASESLKEFSRAIEAKPSRLIFEDEPPADRAQR